MRKIQLIIASFVEIRGPLAKGKIKKWIISRDLRKEPRPPALGVQSLSHWTTREVPLIVVGKSSRTVSLQRWPSNELCLLKFTLHVVPSHTE